ncbi:hypothetical protein [Clostridium colicanis]|uniref:Uncharacterized protein n=1 Tax=Clostridium colicanis DSM 13634 TaxID=1121305 RepID=A0A151ALJ8_9CLOT|nr:hypothetical protein [Clostridium colicanis]KYH28498.1 hypothetical protein CLCOL_19900 [Clostridium colicanis DSM 13634]
MNIDMPSLEEKERAIEYILSEGLTKPKSLWQHLYEMYRALGFQYLFLNTAQPVIISVALMFGFIALFPLSPEKYINTVLFASAPLFFISVVLLTETAERMSGIYELKMTFKYTIRQITAFRMVSFSLAWTVLCTVAVLYCRFPDAYHFLRAYSISLCALFLCSFLSIFIMRSFQWKWIHTIPVLLWIGLDLLPIAIFKERWEVFLASIPVVVTAFIAVTAFTLFLMEIKKLIIIHEREVVYYVGC